MWDFFETVRHRHSVRKFQHTPIEQEKLHGIIEIALSAPSAGDLQAYKIIVVKDPDTKKTLAAAAGDQTFIAEAPVTLAFCADPDRSAARYGERGRELYAIQDATIAAAYAQLAVVASGLGSTWIGLFDPARVKQALAIKTELAPVALLSIGYPAELPELTPRRHIEDIVQIIGS